MPWFSDFLDVDLLRDTVDQYHKSGYCQAGFSVAMAAVSSILHRNKIRQDFYFFFLYTSAQQFKRTQSSSWYKSKEPDHASFLPKEANEIFFLVLFIQLDLCMKHD